MSLDYAVGSSIFESQEEIREEPTRAEVLETISILNDFGVYEVDVPEFKTRNELSMWRRRLIDTALA